MKEAGAAFALKWTDRRIRRECAAADPAIDAGFTYRKMSRS
jgi:hypothetical protein